MAEALLRSIDHSLDIFSAGTLPAVRVHPVAIEVMREIRIDISSAHTKHVDRFIDQEFDAVITVCGDAENTCPVFSGKVSWRLHIPFDDPARVTGTEDEIRAAFRKVRDDIEKAFRRFYSEYSPTFSRK